MRCKTFFWVLLGAVGFGVLVFILAALGVTVDKQTLQWLLLFD